MQGAIHGEEGPADHMLVCLPAESKAYGNNFSWSSGHWLMLNVSCAKIVSRCGGSLPKTLQVQMSGFNDRMVEFNSQARVAPSEEGFWKPEELGLNGDILRCLPRSFDIDKDGACFKQIMHPLGGSQCVGVACFRDEAGTGCRGLIVRPGHKLVGQGFSGANDSAAIEFTESSPSHLARGCSFLCSAPTWHAPGPSAHVGL